MPVCCVDCKNIEDDYLWYSYSDDEHHVFRCKYKAKREKYHYDELDGNISSEKCDKYNPYKLERNIPWYNDRKTYFTPWEVVEMKIVFENPLNEPITDLAIADCIRNHIIEEVLSKCERTIIDGEERIVFTGNENDIINNHIRTIANSLLITTTWEGAEMR